MSVPDDVRYGVFLLPEARTSAAVTAVTTFLRAPFGFVSAGRFPPHVTLAGSLPLAVAEIDLAVDVMEGVRPLLITRGHLAADIHDRADWYGHLSLASHDLSGRPEWLAVVERFVREVAEPFPERCEASQLGVFRFHHADRKGRWWTGFTWELVELIELGVDPVR